MTNMIVHTYGRLPTSFIMTRPSKWRPLWVTYTFDSQWKIAQRGYCSLSETPTYAITPLLFILPHVFGILNNYSDSDLRDFVGWYATISFSKFWGAILWSAWYAFIVILYCYLYMTGSQIRVFKTSVMWSHLLIPMTGRAVELHDLCISVISVLGRPHRRALL